MQGHLQAWLSPILDIIYCNLTASENQDLEGNMPVSHKTDIPFENSKIWPFFFVSKHHKFPHTFPLMANIFSSQLERVHSYISKHIFLKHLLYGNHCSRCRYYSCEQNRPKFPPRDTNILTDRLTERGKCRMCSMLSDDDCYGQN